MVPRPSLPPAKFYLPPTPRPVLVDSSGLVQWVPGSIFHIACKLDLTNYPFDEQICQLDMTAMDYKPPKLTFLAITDVVGLNFYIENGEWELNATSLSATTFLIADIPASSIQVSFTLRRKPEFLVISVLLPIVFLSLLNLLVFLIPVDSGEKISFGKNTLNIMKRIEIERCPVLEEDQTSPKTEPNLFLTLLSKVMTSNPKATPPPLCDHELSLENAGPDSPPGLPSKVNRKVKLCGLAVRHSLRDREVWVRSPAESNQGL
ncbi:neuronal acetylcholine receptor subunit alpha-7 [Elysia marginata]|uniref:Neuronal acetylcholine receptor subunit alpha-7 n=1 Tax=Elysia marginata TaxID=1093978 RepID=A0AAV4JHG6_9GAST|nr:neuronal acetylcholine receptor subunit alpha-7 [Elysia marginata]